MRGLALLAVLARSASAQDGDMPEGMMGGGMEGMMGGGMEGMMGGMEGMEGMMGGGMMGGGMMGGGMMGGMGGMGGAPPPIEGVRDDVPYIQCGACKALVRRAFYVAKTARAELKSRAPTEEEYLTKLEGICDTEQPSGEWIHSFDLVEDGRKVSLKRMPQAGECTVECKTVALACANTMAEAETDLTEAFYTNSKTSKELEALICGAEGKPGSIGGLAGECSKAPPLTPENASPADGSWREAFAPKMKPPPPMPPPPSKKKKKKGKKGKAKQEL